MALARIITRFAPASRPLAEKLRARGFEVQTRSPEEAPSEPADLEITLDECATEEALKRAMRTPDNGVCVFIASGTLTDSLGTVPAIPFAAEPGKDAKPTLEPALEPLLSVAGADGEEGDAANDVESRSQTVDELRAMTSEPAPVAPKLEPIVRQQPEPVSVWPIQQLSATAKEARTEEHPIAAGQREVPGEVVPEAVLAEPAAEPIVITQLAKSAARESIRGYIASCRRFLSRDKAFWTTATVASMAAVAALLLVASARHLPPVPASRVPNSRESQQQSSLKTKRSASTALQRKAPATASSPASSRATRAAFAGVKPAVAPNSSTANANSAPASGVTLASAKVKSKAQHRSAYGSGEDVVAKDTVIRYGSRPAPPSPPAQKQREIKHYSDMK